MQTMKREIWERNDTVQQKYVTKVIVTAFLCIIMFVLTGCSTASTDKEEADKQKESSSELLFDNFVSWNTTLDELKGHYVNLIETSKSDKDIVYKNNTVYNYAKYKLAPFNCCGYKNFIAWFYVIQETGELFSISLGCNLNEYPYPTFEMFNNIEDALVSKYGKATKRREKSVVDEEVDPQDVYTSTWNQPVKDTIIECKYYDKSKFRKEFGKEHGNDARMYVVYDNTNYTLWYNITPEPTSTPSPRPMNGI